MSALYRVGDRRVAMLALGVVLLVGLVVLVPRPVRGGHVTRPPRPVIIAALQQGAVEHLSGRILSIDKRGFILRLPLGTRQVASLRRTVYRAASGSPISRRAIRRGDRVQVTGYRAGHVLLGTIVQDTSLP